MTRRCSRGGGGPYESHAMRSYLRPERGEEPRVLESRCSQPSVERTVTRRCSGENPYETRHFYSTLSTCSQSSADSAARGSLSPLGMTVSVTLSGCFLDGDLRTRHVSSASARSPLDMAVTLSCCFLDGELHTTHVRSTSAHRRRTGRRRRRPRSRRRRNRRSRHCRRRRSRRARAAARTPRPRPRAIRRRRGGKGHRGRRAA